MSSTTDIEIAYSPDGSDALTSSDLTTNGDLLKMLLEMKKEVLETKNEVLETKKRQEEWMNKGTKITLFLYSLLLCLCIVHNRY